MKRLLLTFLFAALVSVGLAEQTVVMFTHGLPGRDVYVEPPARVKSLLAQGWRIVHVAATGDAPYLVVFVLERPDQPKP